MHCRNPLSSSNHIIGRLFAFVMKYLWLITVIRQRFIPSRGSTLEPALSDAEAPPRADAQASQMGQSCTLPCNEATQNYLPKALNLISVRARQPTCSE